MSASSITDAVVIGAGICGVTAALELRRRGRSVALLDPGPLPHPLAASTDVSKAVRMEYGPDRDYMEMGERARRGWLLWNDSFDEPLYHETGMLFLTTAPMAPGGFEYESWRLLLERGHRPERMTSPDIARRFPAWNSERYVDGFFSPHSGWAESGRVVEFLLREAAARGVELRAGEEVSGFDQSDGKVTAVRTRSGAALAAETVVSAVGAWTPVLFPEMSTVFQAVGHPVFHLEVPSPELFEPPRFSVFAADISNTGWYGFPFHPGARILKVANHGVGLRMNAAADPRVVTGEDERNLRRFLAETFPSIAGARITATRRCLYCDTPDEHFWIGPHPDLGNVTIVAGDSGHGFKFAPLWGGWIADLVEGRANPDLEKFKPRSFGQGTRGEEAARYHGPPAV